MGDEGSSPLLAHQDPSERKLSKKQTSQIILIQAISDTQKLACNRIIRQYHGYTPNTNRVGRYIDWLIEKHYVERDGCGRVIDINHKEVIGTIGIMDTPALALGVRDRRIGWTRKQQRRNMHRIVANYRFTMMPICEKNDATRALSIMLKICQKTWLEKYGKPIVWIETVVKNRRINDKLMIGQCYKACGFKLLGLTSGGGAAYHRLKFGEKQIDGGELRGNLFDGTRLRIYAKPLVKNYREVLKE